MKIGFHGVKDLYSDGSHLGAIYHFINTIRKFLEEHNHDKVVVFSDKVTIYSPSKKKYYKKGDMITINKVDIPHYNVLLCKILTGDNSDNIIGIEGLGEKTLIKLFPNVQVKPCTINEIKDSAEYLMQVKKSKVLENILTGKTKNGILGEEFYTTNKKIVDLSNPLITEDGKELVEQIINDTIDPTDRGYKNLMRLMMEDGLFKYLPKNDEAWVDFLRPFMKLTKFYNQKTNSN
jgi:5'-3' exonuclease